MSAEHVVSLEEQAALAFRDWLGLAEREQERQVALAKALRLAQQYGRLFELRDPASYGYIRVGWIGPSWNVTWYGAYQRPPAHTLVFSPLKVQNVDES